MQENFRGHLKHRTCAHHARVDAAISALDVSNFQGLRRFLSVHLVCFGAMRAVAAPGTQAHDYLCEMISCIDRDLPKLGSAADSGAEPRLDPVDPLAMDYMVEGSRLGAQVLKRRWASSTDPKVLNANAYFSLRPVAGRWREICAELALVPADGERAAKITSDTQNLFEMFHRVALTQSGNEEPALEHMS